MWIPLMDYAMKMGVSLSTLRRHIKTNKVKHRIENGKYLLYCEEDDFDRDPIIENPPSPKLGKLESDLRSAQEEIAELKMLIAIYEEKMSPLQLDS